ncbi:MAG: sugar ABC transporter permease [Candidatus Fermentibacteraceae bacterium]|nr:sugar ABC transporter permease [Candidatus Fermentibacteraceae bacterium]
MRTGSKISPYLYILPALIIVICFRTIPILASFTASFSDYDIGGFHGFVAFSNYERMFTDDRFWSSVSNTVFFVLGVVPAGIAIPLVLAMLLRGELKGKAIYRTIYFLPVVTSAVAVSVVWTWLFKPEAGPINGVITALGGNPLMWLREPRGIFEMMLSPLGIHPGGIFAGPSLALVSLMIVSVWKSIGYNTVLFLAGLENIPGTYYEAAKLDGAGKWGTFRHITWPLLSPTTFYVLIMSTIASFQTFALVYVMTPPPGGGPLGTTNVIVFYLFQKAFDRFDIGYASAISVFLFVVLLGLTILQRRFGERRVHYS